MSDDLYGAHGGVAPKIFLLWRRPPQASRAEVLELGRVAAGLARLASSLFAAPPCVETNQLRAGCLAVIGLRTAGWLGRHLQDDSQTWAAAPEYPVDAGTVLREHGIRLAGGPVLPTLGRSLESRAPALLADLSPPFSLVWSAGDGAGDVFVQNDGLGQAQLFEYDDGRVWALSNRVLAFRALGVAVEPDAAQWAVRATLGWFPGDSAGYRHVRHVGPGTQLRLSCRDPGPGGITRARHDVLQGWVHPGPASREERLDQAEASLSRYVRAAMPLCGRLSAGLSGGWDSRAVVATLRAAGSNFTARVRGLPERPDVIVARQLAERAGLPLRVKDRGGLPPDDPEASRRCIVRALRWQAGYLPEHKHKTFAARRGHLDGGSVNVTGEHGEIGRGYWAGRIGAASLNPRHYEDALVANLMAGAPPFLRPEFRGFVEDVIRGAYGEADRYGLEGMARLHFFGLYEGTRRWAAGASHGQTGVVLAPFLNPGYIRATFGYPAADLTSNPFHRHIIARHAPEWVDVPFAEPAPAPTVQPVPSPIPVPASATTAGRDWRRPTGRYNYDSSRYWEQVGLALVDEALDSRDGFWPQLFDPAAAVRHWRASPDLLAIAHLLPDALSG